MQTVNNLKSGIWPTNSDTAQQQLMYGGLQA